MISLEDEVELPERKRPKLDLHENALETPHRIREEDVGISEYVCFNQIGFCGTLKKRWEDFHVHEVDEAGSLCKLTCILPIDVSNGLSPVPDFTEDYIIPIEIDEVLKEIERETMFEASFPASNNKLERQNFHKAIRFNYPKLVSRTDEVDGNRFVVVTKIGAVKGKKAWERDTRVFDPPKEKPFCHFVLYKEGKDTMQALNIIGRMLKINANTFSYAGTKDRRAITVQNVCVKNVSSKRLASLNPRLHGIKVGNFSYSSQQISLGELYGNRFSLVIRDVVAEDNVLHKAIAEWQKHGFINYFGLQRFGHCAEARTYDIGREIIKSNWEKAIDLILMPTNMDLPIIRQVKERYQKTKDAKGCGDDIPHCIEKTLLLGIARYGKNLTAIQTLPRNMRQLYAHSYQSLVWNRVASRRIKELKCTDDKALVGDIYFSQCATLTTGLKSVDSSSELFYDDAVKESSKPEEFLPARPMTTPSMPSVVTEEKCRPSMYQVILPLPGFNVIYPENESGKWYSEFFAEDSLELEQLDHKVKDFSLPGSYRHLLVKPEDVHYEIREYTDPTKPLLKSDVETIASSSVVWPTATTEGESEAPLETSGEKKRALILEFTLPKAAYATMAIRELMKQVTVEE